MLIHVLNAYLHNTFWEGGLLDHKVNAYTVLLDTAKSPYVTVVVVNFIFQLNWCPYTWSNIILGVVVRVFLDEINI